MSVVYSVVGLFLSIAIFLLGISLFLLDFLWYKKHKTDDWRWIKLGYAVIGLFWSGMIFYLTVFQDCISDFLLLKVGIFATLALLNSGALIRSKYDIYEKVVIRKTIKRIKEQRKK